MTEPEVQSGEFTNLASNVLMPVRGEQLGLNGGIIDATKPFELAADADPVVGVREGKAALAVRLFAADGAAGQTPKWKLEFDGNAPGAGRLAIHHYRGPARKLEEKSVRCGLIMLAARCGNETEFAAFLKRAVQIKLIETTQNGVWQVKVKSGVVELEVGLDLEQKQIALRRCNGKDWPVTVFSVNGRDRVEELIGRKAGTR